MCGIAGWVDYPGCARENPASAAKMARALVPRGPDAGGEWADNDAYLVHRRLVVVDPEGGTQPMVSPDCNIILIYNGELYNTEDLRQPLLSKGHTFQGHSDTEVLLHAYLEWGTGAFERLNGIYAFALWERDARRLTLCRDRLGVKPLFYSRTRDGIVFGSELKALLSHPWVRPVLGEDGLRTILLLGPARPPGCGVFENVDELRPGHFAVLTPDSFTDRTYWALHAHEHPDDEAATVQRTHDLIADAAARQLVSDVPLCTFLSGGLDSSILSMLAAKEYAKQGKVLDTYSVDYQDNAQYFTKSIFQPNSDNEYIYQMRDFIGSSHHEVVLDNGALCAALLPATDARDLPGMADVDSSLLLFCREVKRDFTVVQSGECADEIFGGYPWYHREEILFEDTFPWSRSVDLRLSLFAPGTVTHAAEFVREHYLATCQAAEKLPGDSRKDARMREMFLLNLQWFMACLLDRKDRMSMYSGLEVRVPFCDHRIVEYAYNMPWDLKALHGREKGIVRAAFAGELPPAIVDRKKSPYPKTFHPLYTQLTASYVRQIFKGENSIASGLFNHEAVEALMEQPESLSEPWYGQLMRTPQIFAYIIQLDRWFKKYGVTLK